MAYADKPEATGTTKRAVALALTFTAGYVDIIGYLGIYKLFTANMTGNTVHLARNLSQGHWGDAAIAAYVLMAFVAGSVAGRLIVEIGARHRIRSIASLTLFLEAALIAIVVTLSLHAKVNAGLPPMLLLLAAAMGLQTATLTRIGPLTVHTTFVTGMINKFAQTLSHTLFLTYDRLFGAKHCEDKQQNAARQTIFFLSIWILYCSGALAGARVDTKLGLQALALPVIVLVTAIVVDQVHPLALQEERDQA
jgi:uncharacterized membrane protein YoaK (UPF0700 family)